MNTLILYSSNHGATRDYAEQMAQAIAGPVTVVNLRKNPGIDVTSFDQVIIGGAIYAGQVHKEVKAFCTRNLDALRQKRLGLFICCWYEGQEAEKQLQENFPVELLATAVVTQPLGGRMDLRAMNLFERLATRVIAKVKNSASHFSEEAARGFAAALQG